MPNFARLESHDGHQVLARIEAKDGENGEYGPCVVLRCDPSITIEITYGPWPDDETGWDAAKEFMAGYDMGNFAQSAVKMANRFFQPTE